MARERARWAVCRLTREGSISVLETFVDRLQADAALARAREAAGEHRFNLSVLPLDEKKNPLLPPGTTFTGISAE